MTDKNYHLDLHTHSIISHDGGITDEQYAEIFSSGKNFVAITDHNQVSKAISLHAKFGDQVIVGEEIMSDEGEIIGLFLQSKIEPYLSAEETIKQIKAQGGLVSIPHPLEKLRRGVQMESLFKFAREIDVIEAFNSRSREPWLAKNIEDFANQNNIAKTSSSDAHGIGGFGCAYASVSAPPSKENIKQLLQNAELMKISCLVFFIFLPSGKSD